MPLVPFAGLEYSAEDAEDNYYDGYSAFKALPTATPRLLALGSVETFSASGERFILDASLGDSVGKGDVEHGVGFEYTEAGEDGEGGGGIKYEAYATPAFAASRMSSTPVKHKRSHLLGNECVVEVHH